MNALSPRLWRRISAVEPLMRFSHVAFVAVLCSFSGIAINAAQDKAKPAPVQVTPQEMEAFLLHAKIVKMRDAGGGVTDSRRATASDGHITHDIHIQTVDISQSVFEAGKS